jgi:hypothetical protein
MNNIKLSSDINNTKSSDLMNNMKSSYCNFKKEYENKHERLSVDKIKT